jgi:hypothetical protein
LSGRAGLGVGFLSAGAACLALGQKRSTAQRNAHIAGFAGLQYLA